MVLWQAAIHLGSAHIPHSSSTPTQLSPSGNLASFTQPFKMRLPVFMGFHGGFYLAKSNGKGSASYIPFSKKFSFTYSYISSFSLSPSLALSSTLCLHLKLSCAAICYCRCCCSCSCILSARFHAAAGVASSLKLSIKLPLFAYARISLILRQVKAIAAPSRFAHSSRTVKVNCKACHHTYAYLSSSFS